MRVAVFVACVLAASTAAPAQTVARVVDLTSLSLGLLDTLVPVETDGDLATKEWLVYRVAAGTYQVIAERAPAVCFGTPFRVSRGSVFAAPVTPVRVGLVHKLHVRDGVAQTLTEVNLDTPPCP